MTGQLADLRKEMKKKKKRHIKLTKLTENSKQELKQLSTWGTAWRKANWKITGMLFRIANADFRKSAGQ